MKKSSILVFALLISLICSIQAISAQITINIPKLPKINKPKPEQKKQEETRQETPPTTGSEQSVKQPASENNSVSQERPVSQEKPVPKTFNCASDAIITMFLQDIEETRVEAEEFRPGLRNYFVSTRSDGKNLYLEAALSPKLRKDWFANWKENAYQLEQCVSPALDNLAAVAKKTLPGYNGPAGYTLGTPAEKKALISVISDISTAKVLKVGIKQANWEIEKDRYNLPVSRYKHGVIWAQYPNAPTGYCWIFWVNIVQDYAGGGTYGASYANFISRAVAGCPAKP